MRDGDWGPNPFGALASLLVQTGRLRPWLADTARPGFRRGWGIAIAHSRCVALVPQGPQVARNGRARHAVPELADHIEQDVGRSLMGAGVSGLGERADHRPRELDSLGGRI